MLNTQDADPGNCSPPAVFIGIALGIEIEGFRNSEPDRDPDFDTDIKRSLHNIPLD